LKKYEDDALDISDLSNDLVPEHMEEDFILAE
jgi:hypothetical protein